ncbi:hypothetical protein EOE48_05505 [Methylobacterium oryzihabitans]|uniref:Uncharacterized protein n=1 Tax=Methylobacterium oryzihabitans TaxID=2499852 RepID=A0A3S2VXP6_9HYPH|nr:hypothetical protein EOE48_05505 [Methylobacterium oryzihabitans]
MRQIGRGSHTIFDRSLRDAKIGFAHAPRGLVIRYPDVVVRISHQNRVTSATPAIISPQPRIRHGPAPCCAKPSQP